MVNHNPARGSVGPAGPSGSAFYSCSVNAGSPTPRCMKAVRAPSPTALTATQFPTPALSLAEQVGVRARATWEAARTIQGGA